MTDPTRARNVERLQWGATTISWDGDDEYRLDLPHYLDVWPALWLDKNLSDRVRAVPGCEDWLAIVTQAVPTRRGGTAVGYEEPGAISLLHVRETPDMERLRQVLIAAVEEAEQASEIADREANAILRGFIGERGG